MTRRWLDNKCRHHEGPKPGCSGDVWGTCRAGEDVRSKIREVDKATQAQLGCLPRATPCKQGLRGGLECGSYEPYTEAEIEEDERATRQAMGRALAGLSPCCGAEVVKHESPRTTVAHCAECGAFAWRACRRIGEPE